MIHLLARTPLDPEQKQLCGAAQTSAEHLLGVIGDILDFSKIETGNMDLTLADFDLDGLASEVTDLLGEEAQRKGIQLAAIVPSGLRLRGDAGRLRQVFLNLLGNAVKFTSRGQATLRATVLHGEAECTVVRFDIGDTGVGISPETVPSLFRPFTQAGQTLRRRYGGAGLGLAIAKELVRLMEGEIGVESELGAGSNFWFTARFEKCGGAAAPIKPQLRSPVYVCGSEEQSALMAEVLRGWGVTPIAISDWRNLPATNHRESAESALLLPISVNAPDTAWAIAGIRESYGGEIYALARDSGAETRERAALCGFDGVLAMPFRQGVLRRLLEVRNVARNEPRSATSPRPGRMGKVLVAEDNLVNQFVTSRILRELGYAVEIAADGKAAVEAFDTGSYDLILMDCEMPGMDGFEAASAIRARPADQIPIIALTAHAIKGYREKCLASGMDGYLSKPVRVDDLAQALNHWIQRPPASTESAEENNFSAPV